MKRSPSLFFGSLVCLYLALVIGLASAHAGAIVVGNLVRTAAVKPGDTFEGVVFLKNPDMNSADVRLFQTDYITKADGTSDYGEAGHTPRSNAEWITVSPTRVRLAGGETRPVRYKGRVPANAKLTGTYWSMLMVEPLVAAPSTAPQSQPNKLAVALQPNIRFGIQLVTEVGKDAKSSLQVQDKRLVYSTEKRSLELDIANNGEHLLVPNMSVELFDKSGATVGRFDAGRARVYPDCAVRAKVDLTDIPSGKYAAMVLLDSGDAQVLGAQYDLEISPSPQAKPMETPTLVSGNVKGGK